MSLFICGDIERLELSLGAIVRDRNTVMPTYRVQDRDPLVDGEADAAAA